MIGDDELFDVVARMAADPYMHELMDPLGGAVTTTAAEFVVYFMEHPEQHPTASDVMGAILAGEMTSLPRISIMDTIVSHQIDCSKSPRRFRAFRSAAEQKLQLLDSAATLDYLRSPPGNRLEALEGDRAGQHSIRINKQWRVCFVWSDSGVYDVEIVDYH